MATLKYPAGAWWLNSACIVAAIMLVGSFGSCIKQYNGLSLQVSDTVKLYSDDGAIRTTLSVTAKEADRAHISIGKLPEGITAIVEPDTGRGRFAAQLHLIPVGSGPAEGAYPVSIQVRSATETIERSFVLQVIYNRFSMETADSIDLSRTNKIDLKFRIASGIRQDTIHAYLSDLPTGLREKSTAGFGTSITSLYFEEDPILADGYYPITVNAASPRDTITKKVIAYASGRNEYRIDDERRRCRLKFETAGLLVLLNPATGGFDLALRFRNAEWPTADGNYEIQIGGLEWQKHVYISYWDRISKASFETGDAPETAMLRMEIRNGKRRIFLPAILLKDKKSGATRKLEIEASE